mmetsp:Transcript_4644/g.11267  ORF Transcript_4644/g.11267 Transcript_4644/m.11267 type:complete len:99 (+) Transcript_4644:10-306(+)
MASLPSPPPGMQQEPSLDEMLLHAKGSQQMFNRMNDICFRKCVSRFHEEDLGVGEGVCLDRCAAKYFKVNEKFMRRMQMYREQEAAAVAGLGGAAPQQ